MALLLTNILLPGYYSVRDKLNPGRVVPISHSTTNHAEPHLSHCGDQGTAIQSILHRVNMQHCAVGSKSGTVCDGERKGTQIQCHEFTIRVYELPYCVSVSSVGMFTWGLL